MVTPLLLGRELRGRKSEKEEDNIQRRNPENKKRFFKLLPKMR